MRALIEHVNPRVAVEIAHDLEAAGLGASDVAGPQLVQALQSAADRGAPS